MKIKLLAGTAVAAASLMSMSSAHAGIVSLNFEGVNAAYPSGYAYRRWEAGAVLPPLFLVPDYYYADWATLGLEPPPPGAQWVRYGPDLLLVDVASGQVLDAAYGVFYD